MINIHSIAKSKGIKLIEIIEGDEYCEANGVDSYINSSYIIGNDEIQLGIYDDNELKTASFFHEVGHTLVEDDFRENNNWFAIEREAWVKGFEFAKSYKYKFSFNVYRWAIKNISTYNKKEYFGIGKKLIQL